MIHFMSMSLIVFAFFVMCLSVLIVGVFAAIEIYDKVTGADAKRQEQLERLRRYEEEDGDY
jgi:hypothetical protein